MQARKIPECQIHLGDRPIQVQHTFTFLMFLHMLCQALIFFSLSFLACSFTDLEEIVNLLNKGFFFISGFPYLLLLWRRVTRLMLVYNVVYCIATLLLLLLLLLLSLLL